MISWLILGSLLLQQTPPADPEDPGPPVVKRGPNAPRKGPVKRGGPTLIEAPAPSPATPETPTPPSAPPAEVSLIDRARQASAAYNQSLPNFVCDQIVVRSRSEAKPPKWKQQDKVETELMYVDGKEDYRNVRINGKPLKSGNPEDTGSWSTGDWGAALMDILSPATNATFTPMGTDTLAGIDAVTYSYQVAKDNSHWTIRFGKPVRPAYKGVIWIDPQSARVLRTEMQAVRLPADYEMDWVEQMTEYGWVTIAGTKYLLPVKSEAIACFRWTNKCTRNETEYRNYRKFATESTISTTESEISFGDPKPPTPPR
jgi:hypothetical protein